MQITAQAQDRRTERDIAILGETRLRDKRLSTFIPHSFGAGRMEKVSRPDIPIAVAINVANGHSCAAALLNKLALAFILCRSQQLSRPPFSRTVSPWWMTKLFSNAVKEFVAAQQ